MKQRRQWHHTLVLLPGKSHGRRSLEGCSPWDHWGSDRTEQLHFHFHALEKEMATHSSVLAWRIPGTGEPGGLPSTGTHRVGHNWSDLAVPYMKNYIIFEWLKICLFKNFRMAMAVQCNVWFLTGYRTCNFLRVMTLLWIWRRLTFSEDIQTRAFEESWLLQLTEQGFEEIRKRDTK